MSRAGREVPSWPLLEGIGPQDVHWRDAIRVESLIGAGGGGICLDGCLAEVRAGEGRCVLCQLDPAAFRSGKWWTDTRLRRSRWHLERFYAQVLTNLGAGSSPEQVSTCFREARPRTEARFKGISSFLWSGPYKASVMSETSLEEYTRNFLEMPIPPEKVVPARREDAALEADVIPWERPGEYVGEGGKRQPVARGGGTYLWRNREKKFPAGKGYVYYGVTQVWSSRPRAATFRIGVRKRVAVLVNGKTAYRSRAGLDPAQNHDGAEFEVSLDRGWNDLAVKLVSGEGEEDLSIWGLYATDPGDLVAVEALAAPPGPPEGLPAPDKLLPEPDPVRTGERYADEFLPDDDPYLFHFK